MTAVELLVSKIASKIDNEYWCNQQNITEFVEEANKMFEEQIKDSYCDGRWSLIDKTIIPAQQYYNKKFTK